MPSFEELAIDLQDFTQAVVHEAKLKAPELRRALSFIAKVSHVAEQAGQDVLAVLVDVKFLNKRDLKSGRVQDLLRQVALLTVRSRYRDAEEICSRLHHLSEQYDQEIRPSLDKMRESPKWHVMWNLINEYEGALIRLVHEITEELLNRLENVTPTSLPQLTSYAAQQLLSLRSALDELRELSNSILGISGTAGLLELTGTPGGPDRLSTLVLYKGSIVMGDNYEVGQAGAVGPGSHAENMTFNQIWQKAATEVDLKTLGMELESLRTTLVTTANQPEHFIAIGEVAAAEKSAKTGDGPNALQHLKNAGKWAWDAATKIGIGVATAAALQQLGLK